MAHQGQGDALLPLINQDREQLHAAGKGKGHAGNPCSWRDNGELQPLLPHKKLPFPRAESHPAQSPLCLG